jgi:hypothetical protein
MDSFRRGIYRIDLAAAVRPRRGRAPRDEPAARPAGAFPRGTEAWKAEKRKEKRRGKTPAREKSTQTPPRRARRAAELQPSAKGATQFLPGFPMRFAPHPKRNAQIIGPRRFLSNINLNSGCN